MEGATNPWKIQKIECNSPDLDSYGKPLPPPPSGYYWTKLEDNSWELNRLPTSNDSDAGAAVFPAPSVLEHVVLPDDNIRGVCLRYRISAVDLRRYNMFSGDNIHFKKTLRIPVDGKLPIVYQEETKEVLLQRFKNATHESPTEAKIYLEDNNWDLEKAIRSWRGDEHWTKEQLQHQQQELMHEAANHNQFVAPASIIYDRPVAVVDDGNNVELVTYNNEGIEIEPSMMPLLGEVSL